MNTNYLRDSMLANAYLKKETFTDWKFNPPPPSRPPSRDQDVELDEMDEVMARCKFGVSLSSLLECLNIFGNAGGGLGTGASDQASKADSGGGTTSLDMKYQGQGEPLIIL